MSHNIHCATFKADLAFGSLGAGLIGGIISGSKLRRTMFLPHVNHTFKIFFTTFRTVYHASITRLSRMRKNLSWAIKSLSGNRYQIVLRFNLASAIIRAIVTQSEGGHHGQVCELWGTDNRAACLLRRGV